MLSGSIRASLEGMGKHVNRHLTERFVRAADHGGGKLKVLLRDDELSGFGLCIYPNGSKGFFLDYRIAVRRRYYTIGAWPTWSVVAARERARELKRRIDQGEDPTAQRQEAREAATVTDLIDHYIAEYTPRLAPRNKSDQESILRKLIEPVWGTRKVADVTATDVDVLLAKVAAGRLRPRKEQPKRKRAKPLAKVKPTPIRANRVGEILRKMFNLAIKSWGMRADNPAAGFHRNAENEREVFLTPAQIEQLAAAIDAHKNQRAADIIRMILLTGARKGEVLGATPQQFNLELAIWTKNASITKQRKMHRVPLSRAAVLFLRTRIAALPEGAEWLFPGESKEGRTEDIRRFWTEIRAETGFEGVRIHDLRHTFASLLASGGMSLPMIGKLLGHSSPKTTQRYAHLLDDPIRQGVDAIGDMLRPKLRLVEPAESRRSA